MHPLVNEMRVFVDRYSMDCFLLDYCCAYTAGRLGDFNSSFNAFFDFIHMRNNAN